MRIVRFVAVFLGVGLIVAAAAGYVARRAELTRDRDARVETAALVVATGIEAVADRAATTARFAPDPVAALAAFEPDPVVRGACAVVDTTATCVGDVSADAIVADVERARRRGAAVDLAVLDDGIRVLAIGDRFGEGNEGDGPRLDLVVEVDVERLARTIRGSVRFDVVETADLGPSTDVLADGHQVVLRTPSGWAVVVTDPRAVALDPAERNVLWLAAAAGALLLVLVAITIVTDQRRLVERASTDPVTRLPNRSELEARGEAVVQLARKADEGVCVMLVDLDGFKAVNDTYGHGAGDEVLRIVGLRLRNAVRGYDIVGRWGGDEFVIVLPGIGNETFATSRATSLAELVATPIRGGDTEAGPGLKVGASIGIALLGHDGDTLVDLIEAADAAMYEAKRTGRTHAMASPTLTECSPVNP